MQQAIRLDKATERGNFSYTILILPYDATTMYNSSQQFLIKRKVHLNCLIQQPAHSVIVSLVQTVGTYLSVFVKRRFSSALLLRMQLVYSLFQLVLKPPNNLTTSTHLSYLLTYY